MTVHQFDYLPEEIMDTIRVLFSETLKPGDEMLLKAPHRDLVGEYVDDLERSNYHVLPDRFEIPNTFSFKAIIQEALNAICPEAHKDVEEIDYSSAGGLEEAMGFYKFLDLKIEDGYIHALIKKI